MQFTIPCERPSLMVIVSNKSFFTGMVWEMQSPDPNKEQAIRIAQVPFAVKNRTISLKQYSDYGCYKDKELSQARKESLMREDLKSHASRLASHIHNSLSS
jgi:hypothetical protein